jgi:hypothetical protein
VVIWNVYKDAIPKAKKDLLQAGTITLVARGLDSKARVDSGQFAEYTQAWWTGPYDWDKSACTTLS